MKHIKTQGRCPFTISLVLAKWGIREYTAFGSERGQRVGRLREALEVMKRLWTEEEVEHHGQYYQVPRVKPSTRPVQKPHPPIWVAANGDSAIRRAARWGYPWLVNPMPRSRRWPNNLPCTGPSWTGRVNQSPKFYP